MNALPLTLFTSEIPTLAVHAVVPVVPHHEHPVGRHDQRAQFLSLAKSGNRPIAVHRVRLVQGRAVDQDLLAPNLTVSPGSPMTRLMKSLVSSCGNLNTMMSPRRTGWK